MPLDHSSEIAWGTYNPKYSTKRVGGHDPKGEVLLQARNPLGEMRPIGWTSCANTGDAEKLADQIINAMNAERILRKAGFHILNIEPLEVARLFNLMYTFSNIVGQAYKNPDPMMLGVFPKLHAIMRSADRDKDLHKIDWHLACNEFTHAMNLSCPSLGKTVIDLTGSRRNSHGQWSSRTYDEPLLRFDLIDLDGAVTFKSVSSHILLPKSALDQDRFYRFVGRVVVAINLFEGIDLRPEYRMPVAAARAIKAIHKTIDGGLHADVTTVFDHVTRQVRVRQATASTDPVIEELGALLPELSVLFDKMRGSYLEPEKAVAPQQGIRATQCRLL
jgi:hypothetical protein